MRIADGLVDLYKRCLLIGMGEHAVMIPACPQFIKIKELFCLVFFLMNVGGDSLLNTDWIKDDPVRIFKQIEFMRGQSLADMIGKTTTHQHHGVPDVDLLFE